MVTLTNPISFERGDFDNSEFPVWKYAYNVKKGAR
jgi:hypothetical protein